MDLYNFQYALRYLQIKLTCNSKTNFEFFVTFNNSNQMLWKDENVVMQVIKFDGSQMLLTICNPNQELFYSMLFDRRNYDEIVNDKSKNLNHLILKGRGLKSHARFQCKISNILGEISQNDETTSSSMKLNFLSITSVALCFYILIIL